MKLQLVFACVCLFGSAWLAEAVGTPKDKKSPTPKGKSVVTPSPKTIAVTKGLKPPIFKGPDKHSKEYKLVKSASKDWKLDPGQTAAVDKLLAGQAPLTDQERQQLSDVLFNAKEAGLTQEDENALSYLMLDETARNTGEPSPNPPGLDKAGPLFVRIYNNTGERLKVWVQVVSDGEANKEKEPDPKKIETLSYDLATGKAYDLPHNGERLKASVIRVWAISPTRSWADHRDHDLVLTTPEDKSKTYTLTFSK